MVVALGTLKPGAHEHLGEVVHHQIRRLQVFEPDRGGRALFIAGCQQDLAGHAVVGHVGRNRLEQPAMECEGAKGPFSLIASLDTQHIRPFARKIVGMLRPGQQPVSQFSILVRSGIGFESGHLGGGGQRASQVEAHAADEHSVFRPGRRL